MWDKEWLVFEPTVIEDYKRRLSGIDSVAPEDYDPSAPSSFVPQPTTTFSSTTPSGTNSPSITPRQEEIVDSQPQEEEKKSFGGFKMSFKAASFAPATVEPAPTPILAEEDVDVDGEPAGIDVDGEDLDGAEMVYVDGEEVDVDGAPLPMEARGEGTRIEEDQDGEAMEMGSDGDGEPVKDDIFS